ncbi:MAG TPA: peptidylprolyl isomerase [Polyangiaceae bacterium]|nr:MAG: Peptidyl-prolyl cis-trans isomerase B [Deltaproteobacteria bacterium ADurb.Bin207]HNS95737.1 peptidylprolyl isomerase [Polyangiaceae bacterium]HNZ22972.1 peptidylprolyl isomerase [Polyangiaceae bacterium]HOD24062.1 peptidylprolyl isomerase [Polyangiaceae bacterium]HOE51025.1 peptidylprolyl isomerase [Polyangiaceae bacterium]
MNPAFLTMGLMSGLLLFAGCTPADRKGPDETAEKQGAPAMAAEANRRSDEPARVHELLLLENTRAAGQVMDTDLTNADPRVRRSAVRVLARAESEIVRDKLLASLSDHDPEVLAWSAYGLGRICARDRERTTSRLVARSVSLGLEPPVAAGRLDPWVALAGALGKCASVQAEQSLVSWLSGPKQRAEAAAMGLGDVVSQHRRLEEETAASLLRATRGDAANDPLTDALFPFTRLKRAPVRVNEQLFEACRKRLGHDGSARVFVLRSLGTLGEEAVELLGTVLRSTSGYSPAERAEAARALGKIDSPAAQKELLRAIDELAPINDPVVLTSLVGPGFGSLMTALGSIRVTGKKAVRSRGLDALTNLDTPPGAPASVVRRISMLRCAAARLGAGSNASFPRLLSCDSQKGSVGALARLSVIDRDELVGSRATIWKSYLDPKVAVVVRQAAIKMLSGHPEAKGIVPLVVAALSDESLGVVTEGALLIAASPERFSVKTEPFQADPKVAEALLQAMGRSWPKDAIETKGAIARACGALHLEQARSWLTSLCSDSNPTLRQHAKQALQSLGGAPPTCEPSPSTTVSPAPELARLAPKTTLELDTEVGKVQLHLDPTFAPVAVTRIVQLARNRFYDDMAVHRVVPGFVVQFGDKQGDGYGGAGLEALRCENTPVAFRQGVVGMALGGRDTGSSQIFVTLADSPHLNGEYAVVGTATGPWDVLTEGDRINKVTIKVDAAAP